jgi:hypothetical protein
MLVGILISVFPHPTRCMLQSICSKSARLGTVLNGGLATGS